MAASTGIILTASAISFGNNWYVNNEANYRIVAAGLIGALMLDGIERVSPEAAVGLATIGLITLLLTPIKNNKTGKSQSPFDTVNQYLGGSK